MGILLNRWVIRKNYSCPHSMKRTGHSTIREFNSKELLIQAVKNSSLNIVLTMFFLSLFWFPGCTLFSISSPKQGMLLASDCLNHDCLGGRSMYTLYSDHNQHPPSFGQPSSLLHCFWDQTDVCIGPGLTRLINHLQFQVRWCLLDHSGITYMLSGDLNRCCW